MTQLTFCAGRPATPLGVAAADEQSASGTSPSERHRAYSSAYHRGLGEALASRGRSRSTASPKGLAWAKRQAVVSARAAVGTRS